MEREGGGEGEAGGGTTPTFFFTMCTHAQWPPPIPVTLFMVVHPPGVDGGGAGEGSPTSGAQV